MNSGAPHIPPGQRIFGSRLLAFGILGIGGLVVGWLSVVGWLFVGWLSVVGWLVVGGWCLVGRLVGGWWLFWLVCCSFFVVGGRLRATKLFRTTWYHPFEPEKEVVGSWWRHVVAWSVVGGCVGWFAACSL